MHKKAAKKIDKKIEFVLPQANIAHNIMQKAKMVSFLTSSPVVSQEFTSSPHKQLSPNLEVKKHVSATLSEVYSSPLIGKKEKCQSVASSRSSISEQKKEYLKNEKELAERLLREKPQGLPGLRFVLEEIAIAQNQGLIRKKKRGETGKFAGLMIQDMSMKLSKQAKDRELMRIITD